ncbi:MAG: ribonuclease E/G [Bacteroidales bacterium]|nr:ribonuclease E/G [Lachnoclostridium sp.]MCM1384635.1 ribonuclease E/G [Lachnoclostridium sp.]MCM1463826.1 ribonuclease E/G [Bacteroidales bacterium]
MSRDIIVNHTQTSMEVKLEEQTGEGKLIFSKYQGKNCAMLIKGTRLIAMQSLEEDTGQIGAVYMGKIKNVAKNLNACFVEFTEGEIGFLSQKDCRSYFPCQNKKPGQGDEILVQVKSEAYRTKQRALTAHISLANEVAAISLGQARIGYSVKLDTEKKKQIKYWLKEEGLRENEYFNFEKIWSETCKDIPCPADVGIVVRTQAQHCDKERFLRELTDLAQEFAALLYTSLHRTCFSCIREAPSSFESVMNKLVYPYEYSEIVTDDRELYEQLQAYCEKNICDKSVRLYEDSMISLSKLYSLETKIEAAFHQNVWLKSGGYLVIQPTEALTVIDVNSGKYEGKKGGFSVNCEAAEEIALQLRLRNLSGIIIVDFINMAEKEKQDELLAYMRSLVRGDRQRTDVVDMTPLGLVEITRKREAKTLAEQFLHRY